MDAALTPGTTLSTGRYEIDRVLGQGGFGITYQANDHRLHRPVAIKEFFMAGSSREGTTVRVPPHLEPQVHERMDRIRDEARVLARFRHPSIVSVHEFFEENESIYVVMELLEGTTLRSMIDEAGGPLPEPVVLRYATEIAKALGAVHEQNLLHRDVKPDNVMIMPDDQVVLVDFGTAREFEEDRSSLMSQTLSPGYAPVEQYSARGRFGPSTDLYALGATMYHMSTGVFPTSSLDRLAGHELIPPHEASPGVGLAVSQAIMWAMNVEAEDRPQSAEAFLAVLEGGAVPEPTGDATRIVAPAPPPPSAVTAPATPPPTRPPPAAPTRPQQPVEPRATAARAAGQPRSTVSRRKRRRSLRRGARRLGRTIINIAITIAIAVGATFAVAWYFQQNSDDSPQPAPPAVTTPGTQALLPDFTAH